MKFKFRSTITPKLMGILITCVACCRVAGRAARVGSASGANRQEDMIGTVPTMPPIWAAITAALVLRVLATGNTPLPVSKFVNSTHPYQLKSASDYVVNIIIQFEIHCISRRSTCFTRLWPWHLLTYLNILWSYCCELHNFY